MEIRIRKKRIKGHPLSLSLSLSRAASPANSLSHRLPQVANAMASLAGLANLTGATTAMVAALQRYGEDMSLWGPPQTERDGYWPEFAIAGDRASTEGIATVGGFPPVGKQPDATVCKEGAAGCCGFKTVHEAVDAAPEHSAERFVIYIKAGVY